MANPESQALKVPEDTSNRPSVEGNPPECKQAHPTLAQNDSTPSLRPSRVRKCHLDIMIVFWDALGVT